MNAAAVRGSGREWRRLGTWAVAMGLAVTNVASAGAAEPPMKPVEYDRLLDVVYGYRDGMGLILDVLTPRGRRNGAGILVIASGGLVSRPAAYRSKDWQERKPAIAELLRRGFVLFIAKHASRPKYGLSEVRNDMPRAVRYLRHHAARYGIDADRIGVIGGSSGGCLALLLGTSAPGPNPEAADEVDRQSSRVQAVVAYYPVTDLASWEAPSGSIEAGGAEPTPATLADCSPVTHVSRDDPPTLLLHGDLDEEVPIEQSTLFRDRMRRVGADCTLITGPGRGHAWRTPLENEVEAVAGWFDHWLLPDQPRR